MSRCLLMVNDEDKSDGGNVGMISTDKNPKAHEPTAPSTPTHRPEILTTSFVFLETSVIARLLLVTDTIYQTAAAFLFELEYRYLESYLKLADLSSS